MNQDVPQPATATRSPGAGSEPATSAASRAACRQQAGCEATSCAVRLPAVMSSCVTDSSSLSSNRFTSRPARWRPPSG